MRRFLLLSVAASTLLFASCRTPEEGSNPFDGGGTTVDNGHRIPLGIVIQYTSIGSGIDTATKSRIDAIIAEARNANLVTAELERKWGIEGEETTCVGFTNLSGWSRYRQLICAAVRDGNRSAGAPLTQHVVSLKCDNQTIAAPIQSNDTACDPQPQPPAPEPTNSP